ncbi:hypothetical protein [Aurantiacibacter sp. D1-12]|uniref:hypothetical protein n=1 Tax=Aurantiacibacter sp. D1-12 TaxID=2993658 RepID=UPI00237CCBD7|nr:hypothetical protein [Aurantiacibacter sp. D1-12]MDE1467139.1 hypothetical protein [Aurantiacibacter sp. D1-12]
MNTKLDMGQAWNQAVAMLSANKNVIAVVAGVFFFLPNLIATLVMPQSTEIEAMMGSAPADNPEAMLQMMGELYAGIWWIFIPLALVQAVGVLGLLALLTDKSRPTVGEALGFGLKGLPTYIGAQLLSAVILAAVFLLPIMLGALIAPAVAALLGLVAFVAVIYVMVKFSLSSPVIAIEKQLNPVTVLQRSWQITKGNSLRLFAFYLLLLLVLIVISAISGMVFSVFAIMGDQVGLFAGGIGGSLINMVTASVMMAVLAAVHRQLTGSAGDNVVETFE